MGDISLNHYSFPRGSKAEEVWCDEMVEMITKYMRGEPIYVSFDPQYEPKRVGSIGRLVINNMQDILHGKHEWHTRYSSPRAILPNDPKLIKPEHFKSVRIEGKVVWDGRSNRVQCNSGWTLAWVKDRKDEEGTVWVYEKPVQAQVAALDKLGRDIKVGDFISYILYHFDNSHNAAGIYYGKVTKIDIDGTVHAKNIKLKEDDQVDEKRIKDNSLIVIMSKDLMDKLMMARLSIL